MTDDNWKTLRVPVDKYEKAKDQKFKNNRTWGQQIVRDSDESELNIDWDEFERRLESVLREWFDNGESTPLPYGPEASEMAVEHVEDGHPSPPELPHASTCPLCYAEGL